MATAFPDRSRPSGHEAGVIERLMEGVDHDCNGNGVAEEAHDGLDKKCAHLGGWLLEWECAAERLVRLVGCRGGGSQRNLDTTSSGVGFGIGDEVAEDLDARCG